MDAPVGYRNGYGKPRRLAMSSVRAVTCAASSAAGRSIVFAIGIVEARFASRESGISTAAIDGALTRISSQLELLRATRRQITAINNASSKIRTNLEEMERGIEEAINEIRDLLGEEDEDGDE